MFFNEGEGVISCDDGRYIKVFLTASMFVTTPRFMTSSRWKRVRWTQARRKRRPMINKKEVIHHDVTNLLGLLHLTVLAIHSVYDHQYTRPYSCHTG